MIEFENGQYFLHSYFCLLMMTVDSSSGIASMPIGLWFIFKLGDALL
jgi:hypothetical protein